MFVYLQWIIGSLNFFAELVLWVAVGRAIWRVLKPINSVLAITLGILGVIITIVFWAFFLAPKADYRIPLVARIIVIGLMMIVTGYILYKYGDKRLGLALMFPLTIIQAIGQYVMAKA
ncbi:YrdB family protein [Microaceticoccus formicicus]|uniref:YrdB family protein n=1 Tax=Microaceticoccus formicicus TaxID=3118105 RepID=UPI003CD017D3|nr:YrdB family protein [Peptoniphilaceae bacterium AMB_02]